LLRPGTLIAGDFEVLALLSQGGMGEVYRVRQHSTGAQRALKVMLPRWQQSEGFRERFEQEAKLVALIESEHVVKVLGYGIEPDGEFPWLVMEYLRGRTLEEHVRLDGAGPSAWRDAGELLRQLFHGVAGAHRAQIVHRDLKPANVFVAESGRADVRFTVKVLDFGIAKLLREGDWTTEPLGTRAWMAPEQQNGRSPITAAADVWALGLIAFWLLTGHPYFRHFAGDAAELAYETNFAPLVPASQRARELGAADLGAGFDDWFKSSVVRDPELRHPDAAAAWQELEPALSGLTQRPAVSAARGVTETAQGYPSGTRPAVRDSDAGAWPGAAPPLTTRLYNLPLPTASFVGRSAELRELRDELLRDVPRNAVSVEGLPGVGKTELLLKVAHELSREGQFPGGIFWLSAETAELSAGFASEAIAGALGVVGGSIDERAQRVVNRLSESQSPVLIILDNVEQWTEAHQPVPLPLGLHVTLLMSSRTRRLGGTRFRHLALGMLSGNDARLLLTRSAGPRVASADGFQELLGALEGHTLAIELAGAYLSEFPEISPAAYLTLLHSGQEFSAIAAELTRYERTVSQAFALLWQRASDEGRARWLLAAQFAPERVSASLADAAGLDGAARAELRRHHLIEADAAGAFRMHRLTRSFALTTADPALRQIAEDRFLVAITEQAKRIELATGFLVYAPARAHFDTAVELARKNVHAPTSADLFAGIATALHSLGELLSARDTFQLALASDLANFGEDHERVATLRSNLALVYQDLGDFLAARQLLELALRADAEHRSDNAYKLLLRRSNLGLLLQLSGECEAARTELERALSEALPALGEDHVMVAIARSNLCGILTELGELDRAEELIRLALDSDLRRLGDEHPHVGIRRAKWAGVLEARGDRAGAILLLRLALEPERARGTAAHPRVAVTQARLAALLDQSGEHETAGDYARAALSRVQTQPPTSVYRREVEKLAGNIA